MTNVFTLLTLPQTSSGFTASRSMVVDSGDDGSASPPRIFKTPRLAADSDSASASRSKHHSARSGGPIRIQIIGDHAWKSSNGDDAFALARQSIRIILTRDTDEVLSASHEGIYSACRLIVTVSNKGEGLYGNLKLELEQCVGRLASDLLAETEDGMQWITFFVQVTQWFETQVSFLQSLLTYLDQIYIPSNSKCSRIRDLSFSLFSDRIFGNPQITERLRSGVQQWVAWEREYRLEHEFRQHIPQLISRLVTHGQYNVFEEFYIKITHSFYVAESLRLSESMKNDAKGFFKHVYLRVEEEGLRSKDVFPVGSWSVFRETTESAILGGRLEWLATEALGPYMQTKDVATLAEMYRLFARVDGTKVLCAAYKEHVQVTVQNIVKDPTLDDDMVQRLLDFKALADSTISAAFVDERVEALPSKTGHTTRDGNANSSNIQTSVGSSSALPPKRPNQDFSYALTDAFTRGFRVRRNKPAEMIAKYLDKAMRKGQGSSSDAAFEALLDSALALYRFTDDKDVFRTFYFRALSKRLLLEKSASDDFEAAMLKKLKERYDPEFGMAEDMFKDLALSREAMRDYHSKLDTHSPGHKLSVMVLQRSAWPFNLSKSSIDLPPNMQAELTAYTQYYKVRHSGHVLEWDHALGTATMKARFNAGSKELSLSLYQAVTLLLFNESAKLSYKEILEQTRMDQAELRRTLQSLACGKKKVLKKSPAGREVEVGDVFCFNPDFNDPHAKVHINSIQAKVTPEESKRTHTSIEGDRKHYLDAAIVRIMKARKELQYEQLKAATIEAVKSHFVPKVETIKKRIDSLVETEYLKRHPEDKNLFVYVA